MQQTKGLNKLVYIVLLILVSCQHSDGLTKIYSLLDGNINLELRSRKPLKEETVITNSSSINYIYLRDAKINASTKIAVGIKGYISQPFRYDLLDDNDLQIISASYNNDILITLIDIGKRQCNSIQYIQDEQLYVSESHLLINNEYEIKVRVVANKNRISERLFKDYCIEQLKNMEITLHNNM